jgi:ubiquinone/menaquinone biosynthesis C-methylase UbiE
MPGDHAETAADVWGVDRVYPDDSFIFTCHLFGYVDFAKRLGRGALVLDLACGEGYGSGVLADAGARVAGVDITPELLRDSAGRYPRVSFVGGDALRLPFANASFDAVGALQAIEHVAQTDDFVSEMARVLKPDGFAYVTTPNVDRLPPTASKEFNPHHLRDFTPPILREELARHFDDVRLYGQVQDESLPRTQALVAAAEKEWALIPKITRVERIVRGLPGPVRVPLRRTLLRLAGVPQWPLPAAEAARRAVRVEDFQLAEPAEVSGCTVAIARRPK